MRILLFTFLQFLSFIECYGQQFSYPNIISSSAKIEAFIPKDWKIVKEVSSDFNADKITDFAIIIEDKNPIKIDDEKYFPKILLIIFGKKDNTYGLSVATYNLFGKGNWGIAGDPFVDMSLRKNSLKITFCTGGSARVYMDYYFKFREKEWELIGYTQGLYQIPSTDTYVTDVNFITGKEENYLKSKGKITEIKKGTYENTLAFNNLEPKLYKLIEIDAELFIDPFKG